MKPFKTIDEQIQILKNRKLKFRDIDEAKIYLLNNNYYNVVNQYSKFFMTNDEYSENVYFEDFIAVQEFDKNFKDIFFNTILEIENQFKSIIAYRYSEYYQNC